MRILLAARLHARTSVRLYLCTTLAAVSALLACSDSAGLEGSDVTSGPDNFQFQKVGLSNASTTYRYSWKNSGTRALVTHSTSATGGTATLVLKDDAGATVYTHVLVPSMIDSTIVGRAGTWSVEITVGGFSGVVGLRAQKL